MKLNKSQQKLLEEYKKRMVASIDNDDNEVGHLVCDGVLCDLLVELGFSEIVEIYDQQHKWYA